MRQLAAFDFDGTLARGDSLIPFLQMVVGRKRLARSVLANAPALAMVGVGRGDRDATKGRFIAHALTGVPAHELQAAGNHFASELIGTRLFASTAERVRWHKEQGHELVLVSASLDIYLGPLATSLGFNHSITTQLELVDGRATGRLVGFNVRAAEKDRLLRLFLGDDLESAEMWAYGNSSGDYEMLASAQHPFWVSRGGLISPWIAPADKASRAS